MKVVLQLFWRLCLFRQSPAHVPSESWFVTTVVVANLLTSVLISSIISEDPLITISTLLFGLEQIRSGVTCFSEAGGQHVDGMGRAVTELGLRATLCRSTMDEGIGLPETKQWQRAAATPSAASAGEGGVLSLRWRWTI